MLAFAQNGDPDKNQEEESFYTERELRLRAQTVKSFLGAATLLLAVMIIAALLHLPALTRNILDLSLEFAEEQGEQLDLPAVNIEPIAEPSEPIDTPEPEVVEPEPIEVAEVVPDTELMENNPSSAIEIPDISGIQPVNIGASSSDSSIKSKPFASRQGDMEAKLKFGATRETERAVNRGLAWLAKQQQKNGSWSLQGPYSGGSARQNRIAATGLGLMAFQGAGFTHSKDSSRASPRGQNYVTRVKRAKDYLVKHQNANGSWSPPEVQDQQLYNHAIATIAITSAYGMTQDSSLRRHAQKAIDYAVSIQSPRGGWRYVPGHDADLSVTGWFMMAFQSAKLANLTVPESTFNRVSKFLDTSTRDGGQTYRYHEGVGVSPSMTAVGLLCREYLGWQHSDPRLRAGINVLLQEKVSLSKPNVYYWYYASQTIHHYGGQPWEEWNNTARQAIPDMQVKRGAEKGSWFLKNDPWIRGGGRLYNTCLAIFCLEVYYRHLPIYQTQ